MEGHLNQSQRQGESIASRCGASHPELVELEAWLMQQGVVMEHIREIEDNSDIDSRCQDLGELSASQIVVLEYEGMIRGGEIIPETIVLGQD